MGTRVYAYGLCVLALALLAMLAGCGGQRQTLRNPAPLGFVPFTADRMAPVPAELNPRLLRALNFSGSFRVIPMLAEPRLLNLEDLQQFHMQTIAADTGGSPIDSLNRPTAPDEGKNTSPYLQTPRWILTGAFIREVEDIRRGPLIPYLLFRPSTRVVAELEYRLYDTRAQKWVDIGRISVEQKRRGTTQVLDFDPADPSLALLATERQAARANLYDKLFEKLIESLEEFTHAGP